MKLAGTMF